MSTIESFQQQATEYGCSQEEIAYITNLIQNDCESKYLFTMAQFKAFCVYWRKYNGICSGMWSFSNYPKNNGIELGQRYCPGASMTLMYLVTDLFSAHIGPAFINDVDKAYQKFKTIDNKLILLIA